MMKKNEKYCLVRSVLYMPGSNPRALDKGRRLDCDAIIMDLEDAVAPAAKALARDNIAAELKQGGFGARSIAIRINGMETAWGEADLEMALASTADTIVLPKVETAEAIHRVADRVNDGKTLWAMIETPAGVLNVQKIAAADQKLECLVMGTSDLARELKCAHTPDRAPFLVSFGLCILAARAFGLYILDGVHLDLDDEEGYAQSCRQALDLGFDGKTLIHPRTIATANEVFSPGEAQLAEAHDIIDAYRKAVREGSGVTVLNGRLIENLHVEMAQRLLELEEAIRRRSLC